MSFASADPFRVVSSDRFHQHDDQEAEGAEYETMEERSDRLYRERTEQALIDSAEMQDADLLKMEQQDRRYREEHPVAPTNEMLQIANEYMAKYSQFMAQYNHKPKE